MKGTKVHSLLLTAMITVAFMACETNPAVEPQADVLPDQFTIKIPSSLSNPAVSSGRFASGRVTGDIPTGDDIYGSLNIFIGVGEFSADIVDEVIKSIRRFKINKPMTLTYQSDDDSRDKTLIVEENVVFEGETFEFGLTMTDSDSEGNNDGGKAMQIFWNTDPVKGVAILKPFNIDRLHDADQGEAVVRIDYNSAGDANYDATMEVSVANLPLEDPSVDLYSLRALKMFVGEKGDIVDVYGNSSHPNARFFTDAVGFNWAFVASGDESQDIGVAEVGLPPSNLDSNDRAVLLGEYSIKNVFVDQITQKFPGISQTDLDAYLVNALAPGYFNSDGFVVGGASPGAAWDGLADRITDLTPFNPVDIANLTIDFN